MKNKVLKVLITAVALIIIIVGSALAEIFVIGKDVVGDDVTFRCVSEGDAMRIIVSTPESAVAFRNQKVKVRSGIAFITAKKVLVSPLWDDGSFEIEVDIATAEKIVLGEKIIWTKDDIK